MEIQGQKKDFVPRTHIHFLIHRLQGTRIHLGKNLYSSWKGLLRLSVPRAWTWLQPGWDIFTLLQAFGPTTWDSFSVRAIVLYPGAFAHKLSHSGNTHWSITLTPWQGDPWNCWDLILSMYSLPSRPLGASFSTPLPALPGLSREDHPLVVGSPSCSSWVVVDGRIPTVTVLCHSGDNPVCIT